MLVRLDVVVFATLLCPLLLAGVATAGFAYHPPRSREAVLGLLAVVGLPLYFAGIIVHYRLFKEKGRGGPGYSRVFTVALIVLGYTTGVILGVLGFRP